MSYHEDLVVRYGDVRRRLWNPPPAPVALLPPPEPKAEPPPDIERDWLHVSSGPQHILLEEILCVVCEITKVPRIEITSRRREVRLVRARHLFFWLARHHTSRSYPRIGQACGNRDHSTVMHGVNKVDGRYHDFEPLIKEARFRMRLTGMDGE